MPLKRNCNSTRVFKIDFACVELQQLQAQPNPFPVDTRYCFPVHVYVQHWGINFSFATAARKSSASSSLVSDCRRIFCARVPAVLVLDMLINFILIRMLINFILIRMLINFILIRRTRYSVRFRLQAMLAESD